MCQKCIIITYIDITLKLYIKILLQFSTKFVLWNVIEHDGTSNKYKL